MSVAGWIAVGGFLWLALFQAMLAAGLPLGRMAWGGAHRVLPGRLRAASLAVVPFALLGAAVAAQAAGLAALRPPVFVRPILGAFAALFALSLLGNAASRSRAERLHGVPLALVLALSCGALALGYAPR
ncbi:hypothetical protein [Roseicyclus sp.]|uniref:hypothetical protein n=1 Tax=Roseicyclus sp. TaxID=1914329 RepID=UPI003FA180BD